MRKIIILSVLLMFFNCAFADELVLSDIIEQARTTQLHQTSEKQVQTSAPKTDTTVNEAGKTKTTVKYKNPEFGNALKSDLQPIKNEQQQTTQLKETTKEAENVTKTGTKPVQKAPGVNQPPQAMLP